MPKNTFRLICLVLAYKIKLLQEYNEQPPQRMLYRANLCELADSEIELSKNSICSALNINLINL